MEKKAAKTTWSPMVHVVLEELVLKERRVIHDDVTYQLLPALSKGFVNVCRIHLIRRTSLKLVDRGSRPVRSKQSVENPGAEV